MISWNVCYMEKKGDKLLANIDEQCARNQSQFENIWEEQSPTKQYEMIRKIVHDAIIEVFPECPNTKNERLKKLQQQKVQMLKQRCTVRHDVWKSCSVFSNGFGLNQPTQCKLHSVFKVWHLRPALKSNGIKIKAIQNEIQS